MGFAACDNVDLGTGIPVVNPELPAAGPELVTVVKAADAPAVARLADYYDRGENVPVATATTAEGWPEGYGFAATAQVSADESFGSYITVPVVVTGETFAISPAELNEVVRENFTKNPVETTVWIRYNVSAAKGSEKILLGGPDTYFNPMSLTVVSFPPTLIDKVYYYAWSTTPDAWTVENTVALNHPGDNQYDNPEFSAVFTATAGTYWKIIPGSVLDESDFSAAIGVDPANTSKEKGALMTGIGQEAGEMTIGGIVEFRFDFEKMTFEYKQAIPYFWLAGTGVNGTSWNNGQFAMVMWTEDYESYAGYAHLDGAAQPEFKFSPTNAWNGDFGVSDDLNFTENAGVYTGTGSANGGNNIKVPAEGLYFIKLNYPTRDLTLTSIRTIGLIGDFNGWSESLPMTPSADLLTWKATVTLSAGNGWKFRMNDGWDINLGGTPESLTCFGNPANIVCAEDGTYDVTLNLATIPYTATLVKQ